jgi:O-antigen/teichoic acid export membrane protein
MQYATIGLVAGKIISMFWILAVVSVFYVGEPTQGAFNQLMLAGVVGNLFAFLYTFYYALRFANLRPQFCRAYWKEILVGAFPYGLALMFNAIYFRVDSLLLLQFKGVKELGFYGPPMRILEILNVIPVYFMNSVLPVLSKEIREGGAATLGFDPAAGETGKAVRIIQLCFNFLFLAGLPMAIGLYILAYPIIFMVAQPEFLSRLSEGIYGSDVALQILVVSMFFAFLNSVFNYALIALSKQNFLLWINGGAAVVNVLINVAVIPLWGFRGAAITSIFTEIFILAAAYLCARRFIKFRFDFLALLKISGAGAVMGAVVWLLRDPSYGWLGMQNLNVLFLTAIGATVYGGLIWLMKVVPREISSRDV